MQRRRTSRAVHGRLTWQRLRLTKNAPARTRTVTRDRLLNDLLHFSQLWLSLFLSGLLTWKWVHRVKIFSGVCISSVYTCVLSKYMMSQLRFYIYPYSETKGRSAIINRVCPYNSVKLLVIIKGDRAQCTESLRKTKMGEEIQVELRDHGDGGRRRPRPRSASFIAVRSAVFQLTSLSDFKLEKIGSGFFADVYKVRIAFTP